MQEGHAAGIDCLPELVCKDAVTSIGWGEEECIDLCLLPLLVEVLL